MEEIMMAMNGLELNEEDMAEMDNTGVVANGWKSMTHWVGHKKKALIVAGHTICGIAMCAIAIGAALGSAAFSGIGAAAVSVVTSVAIGGTLGCAAGHIAAETVEIMDK